MLRILPKESDIIEYMECYKWIEDELAYHFIGTKDWYNPIYVKFTSILYSLWNKGVLKGQPLYGEPMDWRYIFWVKEAKK